MLKAKPKTGLSDGTQVLKYFNFLRYCDSIEKPHSPSYSVYVPEAHRVHTVDPAKRRHGAWGRTMRT